MESETTTPPPITAETPTDTPPFHTAETTTTAPSPPQVPQDPAPSDTPPQTLESQPPPLANPSPSHLIDSINDLKSLSAAMIAFHQCYDDLSSHLDSIKAAIMSKMPSETPIRTIPPPVGAQLPIKTEKKEELSNQSEVKEELQKQSDEQPPKTELEGMCRRMSNRDIRRYVVNNLSDLPKLREELPKALKMAPSPSKLLLECMGRFFLQGKNAYAKKSPMIPAREASIFILECFLAMDNDGSNADFVVDKAVREEAQNAALAWRKRLVTEGGVASACEIEARGLLLFVTCFGILKLFKREDFRDLLVVGNVKEIAGVLKKSMALMDKIPEVVEWMIKNKMELDAVDMVYTFGLEQRFNPKAILSSFIKESNDTAKKAAPNLSNFSQIEANKKQLSTLKSIIKCLEKHKANPTELLAQITEKISTLEKEISYSNSNSEKKSAEKSLKKRKIGEPASSKGPRIQEQKRSRFTSHAPQHRTSVQIDTRRINNNPSEIIRPSYVNTYSTAPSVTYGGPGAGLPENMLPPANRGGGGGALSAAAPYGVHSSGQGVNHSTTHPYTYHGDSASASHERYQPSPLGLTNLYRTSNAMEGFAGVPSASSVGRQDLYQFADSVVEKEAYARSVGSVPGGVPAHHPGSYMY